jgi:broad specificity phosphatase PhoE
MRIIFVRHGEPDYEHDCLTKTGRHQAAAVAERLSCEGITAIYSSPNGRARETAEYTARWLGLPVMILDYMHEVSWGGPGIPEAGHPWTLSDWMIDREDFDFYTLDWRNHPYFAGNTALQYYDLIAEKIDTLLLSHGYRHEKRRFLCETGKDETIALFSHGGSGACALSHLLALPFPYVCTVLPYEFTSVSILDFPVREGQYVHPRIELFNDTAHIKDGSHGVAFQLISE